MSVPVAPDAAWPQNSIKALDDRYRIGNKLQDEPPNYRVELIGGLVYGKVGTKKDVFSSRTLRRVVAQFQLKADRDQWM